ncbi:MAG: glycosyltransferase family 4 protein [Sarcina sp.]
MKIKNLNNKKVIYKNKKILYITTVSRTINAFLIPHIKMLEENGHLVEIACNYDIGLDNELKHIKFHNVSFSRNPLSFRNLKAIRELQILVEQEKYDIVHVHTPVASFVTRLALRKKNLEMIYTAHGFHFYNGAPIINWGIYYTLEKLASKWTDKLITINNEDFKRAKLKFENKRCKVYKINGIGIDLKEYSKEPMDLIFKESLGIDKNDFVITVIAELIKRKNHKQIIDAIYDIDNKSNIKILFAGNGVLTEKLKNYVKKKGLEKNIIFLGFRRDIESIISISNIIGLFSYQEGLPRNLMEAMAQGKAIICTNIRGNNDLVKDEDNGILVEINDIKATVTKLEYMYLSSELLVKMGEQSLMKVEKYKIQKVLEDMKEIYSK